ncbi:nitrate/nitrite transporter NarK [Nocardiopsis sp. Huas11]|uniref:L-lactate MFS transporter n=1 Tax=Nocardiopsis sp. Huas11 TaxID=2183912 RepID=UPI000EAC1E36|nr:OFA family MFS transporter [Nocardiopsis sp. Huas11]RKS08026.1 nitrate/nitrite transporter NarK [Nocardiopsis sp. Huas11]
MTRSTSPLLDYERSIAPPGYSRWLIPPAALAVHLSIGQVYAFSVFRNPLVERFDTSLTAIGVIFSISIVMLGLSAAFGGTWVERNGPRKAMFVAGLCWSGGFAVAALGVATGQLWLVYLGYGFLGGIGLGIGYISPVSTLIKWFPDRPGLATGIAIMGFGGGALIASPLSAELLTRYADTPVDAIVPAFLTLGAVYFVVMMMGAFTVRVPPAGWTPGRKSSATVPPEAGSGAPPAPRSGTAARAPALPGVAVGRAVRTPQFWLLWTVLFCNVTAGIGILEQASPMVQEFFTGVGPAEAAGYVGFLSLCNMLGRILWSSTSDVIGRKRVYIGYLGLGGLLYLLIAVAGTGSVVLFVALTGVILSFYGGGFATVPAYLKDLFGTFNVGAIHGRLLTAWSLAGIAGPMVVNVIADVQLAAGRDGAALYGLSLYVMVGVMAVGFLANMLIRPLPEGAHDRAPEPRTEAETEPAPGTAPAVERD